jgi:hypothetical protein
MVGTAPERRFVGTAPERLYGGDFAVAQTLQGLNFIVAE